jgi:hypothetical protein
VRRRNTTTTWHPVGSRGRSVQWQEESLELRLASGDTREVARILIDERVAREGNHQSVTVPAEGVLRIAWRGHGNDVVPPLDQVLAELSPHVEVAAATRRDRPNWFDLSDAELDELVAQLVRSGDQMEAGSLLVHRGRCSTTEAHRLVKELETRI